MFDICSFTLTDGFDDYAKNSSEAEKLSVNFVMNRSDLHTQMEYITEMCLSAFFNSESNSIFLARALSKHVQQTPELRDFKPSVSFIQEERDYVRRRQMDYCVALCHFKLHDWAVRLLDLEVVDMWLLLPDSHEDNDRVRALLLDKYGKRQRVE